MLTLNLISSARQFRKRQMLERLILHLIRPFAQVKICSYILLPEPHSPPPRPQAIRGQVHRGNLPHGGFAEAQS